MSQVTYGDGSPNDPWLLKTPPLTSTYSAWRDETADPPALVVQVGTTRLSYHLRALDDLRVMLEQHSDWMPLGNADEGKPVKTGTVEAWARDPGNPVGGYYGLRKGYRGRLANYVTPSLSCWAGPSWSITPATIASARCRSRRRDSRARPVGGRSCLPQGSVRQ